jgi:hypothetical protein
MENTDYTVQDVSPLTINNEINSYLVETAKWGKFLAIIGYIGIGFMVIAGIFVMVGFSALGEYTKMPFPMGAFGIVYILIAVLYYFPVSYLHKFSDQTRQAVLMNEQGMLDSGFANLKSLFKFMGILMIVILSIYALVLVVAIPVALLAA